MISAAEALAALVIGVAGSGHCLGMCGGIASALGLGAPRGALTTPAYHAGRILSYTALGALLGFLTGRIDLAEWTLGLRYLAGGLLLAMGLAIAEWWRGIARLERAGARLWAPVQAFSGRLLPIRGPLQAAGLGLCWGLMPCGLIYSALAWAATAQSAFKAALLMLLFGIGTLPSMLATSLGATRLRRLLPRRLLGLALVLAGLWTLYLTYEHGRHLRLPLPGGPPARHDHARHPAAEKAAAEKAAAETADRPSQAHPAYRQTPAAG